MFRNNLYNNIYDTDDPFATYEFLFPSDDEDITLDLSKENRNSSGEPQPPDNIGREFCYWCGRKTVAKPLFSTFFEFCDYCKK